MIEDTSKKLLKAETHTDERVIDVADLRKLMLLN